MIAGARTSSCPVAPADQAMDRSQPGWDRLRRGPIQALIAVGLVAVWWIVAASSIPADGDASVDPPPPSNLLVAANDLESTLLARSAGECSYAKDMEAGLEGVLSGLGLEGWVTQRSPGITDRSCVGFGIATNRKVILLVAALPGSLRQSLQAVAETSYERCLKRDEATSLVTDALAGHPEIEWRIRGDAPIGGPIDQLDAIVAHVKSGCFIYSGTGMSDEGMRLFFVVGQ